MPEPVHALILTSTAASFKAIVETRDLFDRSNERHPRGWSYSRCVRDSPSHGFYDVAIANVATLEGVSAESKLRDLVSWLRPTRLVSCDEVLSGGQHDNEVTLVKSIETPSARHDVMSDLPTDVRVLLSETIHDRPWFWSLGTGLLAIGVADAVTGVHDASDALLPLMPELRRGRCVFVRGRRIRGEEPGAGTTKAMALVLAFLDADAVATNNPRAFASAASVGVDEATLALFDDVTVEHLAVHDFKNISSIDLDLDRSATSSFGGRWLCLAGVNGAGKSAVLQSLVLGLLGPRYAAELGGASLQRMRRDLAGAPQDARIEVTVRLGDSRHVVPLPITARGATAVEGIDRATHERIWEARAPRHLLLAYGPGRNLSEHIDSRHDGKSEEVRRVITLFDPLAQVASAEAILRARDDAAAIVKTARGLLAEVLEESLVALDEPDTTLRFRMGDTRLGAVDLPDGFRSTIAWLVDLCASWHAIAPERAASGDHREIRALVVIDEIDLHLHPRLQRVLVPRLRKALPRVQWVVSTHSPLVLGCFDRREIVMLARDDAGHVTQREVDRQVAGFSTDEIYEWLMDTPPRSAAIDALRQPDGTFTPEAVRLLAQSPAHDEASVARAYAFQQSRARGPVAQGLRDEPTTAGDGEEPSR